jgi:HSP20 family protein
MSFVTLWNSTPRRPWAPTLFNSELDRLFDEALTDTAAGKAAAFSPAADLAETEAHYQLDLDLPGVKKEAIQIEVRENRLHISGERKFEKSSKLVSERAFGHFERVWNLPEDVDAEKVEAAFADGVLTVRVAKAEAAKPRVIQIQDRKAE